MIKSGRQPKLTSDNTATGTPLPARITAIFGAAVFALFLCASVGDTDEVQDVGTFGDGAYAVFAPVDGTAEKDDPEDAIAEEDGSVWAYLESAIARLIFGE